MTLHGKARVEAETVGRGAASSNLKLASGFARIPELLANGVRVTLGADGAPCNNRLDAFAEMRLAALLQSLMLGFRTLAIEKRSSEVWKTLEEVKREFGKFGDVLDKVKKKLNQATSDIDELSGTRTNMIERKLKAVQVLPEADAALGLPVPTATPLLEAQEEA
jgi:DNA recombination protein RmuC